MSAAVSPAGPRSAPAVRRIYGLGSLFGKTMRDSRRAILLVGGILALILVGVSQAIVNQFATPASREELEAVIAAVPPILQGLAGPVVNVGTLGGYMSYKYGTFFPLVASLWSILALSGTLAGEARRGSLEFVAAEPLSRRRVALEKLLGHLVAVGIATLLVFLALLAAGNAATLPGDEIPVGAAAGYAIWLALMALAAGGLAFALAQFFGRGAAVGIAGAVMFGGFILNGYRTAIPPLEPFANLTWFGWTANHIPLVGRFDWPSVVLVGLVAFAFLAIGVEAFVRRDLGATSAIPTPSLPRALVGLHGPAGRTFGNLLPSALAWGLGIGVFGLMIAGSGQQFVDQLVSAPDFRRLLQTVFPNIDVAAVGGFLQLAFTEFGLILAGLAAATLVGAWASDETTGRLEFLLATPLSRRRWVTAGGVGVLAGLVVATVLTAIGIALGATISGDTMATPVVGTLVLLLYGGALAGVGVAIAGVFGSRFAAPAVAIITIVTGFLDTHVPALGLPDAARELALTAHYGLPMLGQWDAAGIIVSVGLAVAGVAIGSWGFRRRDLRT
jgi:ABC-2 type transport system permease protein